MSRVQWFWFGVLVLVVALTLFAYQVWLRDPLEGHQCVQWYRSAHTAADTSIVDSRLPNPTTGPPRTPPSRSCGTVSSPIVSNGHSTTSTWRPRRRHRSSSGGAP